MADNDVAADDGGLRGAVESAIDAVASQPKETDLLSIMATEPKEQADGAQQQTTTKVDETAGDQQPTQAQPSNEKPLDPHANWPKEAKERFGKLDKDSQAFMLEREQAMQADYTRKTQELSALRRDYEPVDKLFTPYKDQMKSSGHTPFSLIEGWANVEKALMNGKGIDVVRGIVHGYKLDANSVIAALGAAPGNSQQQQPGQQVFQLPPEVQAKLQKIDQFETRFQAQDQAVKDAEVARVSQAIDDFKSAKDGQGNALHPHFEDLETDMAVLAQVVRAQGKTPDLNDLYEKAVYANPSTRAKVLAAEKQSEEKRLKEEARAKAEKARKASSSVTGAPSSGSSQPLSNGRDSSMSLRDQIAQSVSELAQ